MGGATESRIIPTTGQEIFPACFRFQGETVVIPEKISTFVGCLFRNGSWLSMCNPSGTTGPELKQAGVI